MNKRSSKLNYLKKSILASLTSVAVMATYAHAGTIEGRVTDGDNRTYFEGARVELKQQNKSVISARDGFFRFDNLSAGQYTLVVTYLGAKPVEQTVTVSETGVITQNLSLANNAKEIDEVLVIGQRAGQANALNRQKNASSLKSIVSADSIGQLPDQNAAEALQRLPGMFIQRDQGEGRFVGIRGIDPNLNNVTINGVNVPSPEAGVRSVAMDVIPSELIQSLEVSKTVTSDMDASAVGGSIEVKSLSAFDRAGRNYSLTVQESYNAQVSEASPKLSASFSDIVELDNDNKLGVAAAVSWFERDFGSLNMETDGGWAEIEAEDAATGDDAEFFGAEEIEQRYYRITRERLGVAVNLDLHTSSTDKYFLRTLWSEFSDDEFRLRNEYKFADGAVDLTSLNNNSCSFAGAEMDRDTKDRYESQSIMSIVAGGENQLNDWTLEYTLGYSKSEEKEPDRIDVDFKGEDLDLAYLMSGPIPVLTQSANAHDLSNFELDEIVFEDNLTEDEDLSLKIDLTKDFVVNNHNAEFKWGAKLTQREKFNRLNSTVYDGGFNDASGAQFAVNIDDYDIGDFGPGFSRSAIKDYFFANQSQLEINANDTEINSLGQSYVSEEDVLAVYGMVTMDIDNWHVVAGVRLEDTQFSTSGNRVELVVDEVADTETVGVTPLAVEKDYSHFMPNLNVRYDMNEQLVMRFAYTQTIARPTFEDAAAFQLIETESKDDDGVIEIERKAEVGNPELDPYESTNLDFSVEYYPGHIGVLSASIFYKDIDNFIVLQEVEDNGQWDGFDEVLQKVNGGSASLQGFELAWTKNFDSGLMLSANGTFIDADDQLPQQADVVGNLMLGYENDNFSSRLSLSHKGKSFQFEDNDSGVYQDAHTQLDFSAKYYINDSMQVYFNAVNLTDEAYYLYHGSAAYNYQYETYGRSYELGFTFSSF
ncbi:TonB-dependent receptor [Paraglaciecola sp.]|uniref:TonB-dependent receptor n=1 Tax=Paraglaciecola sp. TaxID=1920173 RepID=UPI003EF2CD49